MKALIILSALFINSHGSPFSCGESKVVNRKYGKVNLKVECSFIFDSSDNNISVLEYKGKIQHGISIHYDSLWRKHDSCMFVNGKEDGDLIFWDSIGNIVGHERFKNGIQIGLREYYWSPGHPSMKKNYNAHGEADGVWQEWWKNGNMKVDFIAKNGQVVSGTEFYMNGKPRIKYVSKYSKEQKSIFETEYLEGEAWTSKGKSTGKIVNGNGSWVVFPNEADTTSKHVFREVYKDKTLAKIDTLSNAEVAELMK